MRIGICDRCGRRMDVTALRLTIHSGLNDKQVELCDLCAGEFASWAKPYSQRTTEDLGKLRAS